MNSGDIIQGRYEIIRTIGTGGMSEVFLVKDRADNNREMVLKKLHFTGDPKDMEELTYSFRNGVKILSRLHHPNIPRVFDHFEDQGLFYVVEEYIKGEVLRVSRKGKPHHEAIKIILQVCDVLEYLHKQGVVYRDLKPENLIIDNQDRVWLVDFGISRLFIPGKKDDTVALGTPGYAPPEAYREPQTDERTDIYCMCALLHQLLTGRNPADTLFKFKPPHKIDKTIPAQLSELVMKGLSLDPSGRFPSIRYFREELLKQKALQGKFKSYRKKLGKRSDFIKKERPEGVFDKFKTFEFDVSFKDIIISIFISFFAGYAGHALHPLYSPLLPLLLFIVTEAGLLLFTQLGRRKFVKVAIYRSGLSYTGTNRSFSALWDDVYAIKYNLSKSVREVTVVTLEGDFTFSARLEGWDQLMKEIQRRAGLRLRHDISGRFPELEIHEKL